MADPRVFVGDLTRKEFRHRVQTGTLKAAIVPVAATEQHEEHLEMFHDTLHVTFVAEQVARRLHPRAVVTTPVGIGVSEHWMAHPGTLTIRPEVFCEYVFDVCNSMVRAGIPNVLILNGHGGNVKPLMRRIDEYRDKLRVNLRFQSYWDVFDAGMVQSILETRRCPGHAGEFETSTMLVLAPERVRRESIEDAGAAAASAEKGEPFIQSAIAGVAEILEKMIAGEEVNRAPLTFGDGAPIHMVSGEPIRPPA